MTDTKDIVERLLQTAHDFELHDPQQGVTFRGRCDVEAIREAAAEITRLREGWQAIETAPTNDPEFQALACNRNNDGWWSYYIINRHDIGGRYECWVVPPGRPITPTHWCPLPSPPNRRGEDDMTSHPEPDDMIERVARAIAVADDSADAALWRAFLPEARAAIAAMREPTEGMVRAADRHAVWDDFTKMEFWHFMIDAALGKE